MHNLTHRLYTTCVQKVHSLGTTSRKNSFQNVAVYNTPTLYQLLTQTLPTTFHSLRSALTTVTNRPFHTIHTPYKETKILNLNNITNNLCGEL